MDLRSFEVSVMRILCSRCSSPSSPSLSALLILTANDERGVRSYVINPKRPPQTESALEIGSAQPGFPTKTRRASTNSSPTSCRAPPHGATLRSRFESAPKGRKVGRGSIGCPHCIRADSSMLFSFCMGETPFSCTSRELCSSPCL